MKHIATLLLFAVISISTLAQFGDFASAVKINNGTTNLFYNTTGTGVNQINPAGPSFVAQNLGTYIYQSNGLRISGAEVKTFKNTNANVCGAKLYYALYPTATPPAIPVFTAVSIPFKCDCGLGLFNDALGPCGPGDQKWSTEALNIDLTNICPNAYTIDVYYDYTGSATSTTLCTTTQVINNSGVRYKATFTITPNLSGTAATTTPIVCAGNTISLQANGILGKAPYTYNWTGPNAFTNTNQTPTIPNATTAATGTYNVTITDACSNTVLRTINVLVNAKPNPPTVTTPLTVCQSDVPPTLTATGVSLTWYTSATGGSGTVNAPQASTATIGSANYYVSQTVNNCESDRAIITVNTIAKPSVNAGADVTILAGDATTLNGSVDAFVSYTWTPINVTNTLQPAVTPTITTNYTLTATNASGCKGSDMVTVIVIPYCIKVRNAFTPNGDGINDKWLVSDGNACLTNIVANVYNRYGGLVYSNTNYNNNWDGTYKGKNVSDATYYYVLDITLINGTKVFAKGDVTILR